MSGTAVSRAATVDDGEIVHIVSRHDSEAFATLYRQHVDPIYRFCYRRLGTKEAAEDATSQVFAKALSGLADFRGGSFRSWLFTIASNVVADVGRASRPTAPIEAAASVIDPAPGPEEETIASDEAQKLRALLAALPSEQRRVLELRLAGLSGVEIALVLGRSHGTVRNLQHRTLIRLRELMGKKAASWGSDTYA
ncbi:MAG: RNA polymerase sigma factor [Thermomicrobiales bacterium]